MTHKYDFPNNFLKNTLHVYTFWLLPIYIYNSWKTKIKNKIRVNQVEIQYFVFLLKSFPHTNCVRLSQQKYFRDCHILTNLICTFFLDYFYVRKGYLSFKHLCGTITAIVVNTCASHLLPQTSPLGNEIIKTSIITCIPVFGAIGNHIEQFKDYNDDE